MRYLVDCYNLLFALSSIQGTLQQKREAIIAFLSDTPLDITLVFDGGDEFTRTSFGPLDLIYTKKRESADDYILSEVERTKHPASLTVVTSDRRLAQQASYHGAQLLAPLAFWERATKKKPHSPQDTTQEVWPDYLDLFTRNMKKNDEDS